MAVIMQIRCIPSKEFVYSQNKGKHNDIDIISDASDWVKLNCYSNFLAF
jgi:hypothetical protein